jgi:hypothetical protein
MTTLSTQSIQTLSHQFDVCVVGGGMAGMCAAIAAARNGAKTCLVHDRPVLGGNASSEVRMWICGCHGKNNKETGILEEIQLENCYRNPSLNYSIWDSVLWSKVHFQPNLTTFLNTTVLDGEMAGNKLKRVKAWTLTTQTWHDLSADTFIDCSGDSILAPITGADCRWGREASSEFDEDIEPANADRKTMGNTLLIQLRRTDEPQPFVPPKWAWKFTGPDDLPHRMHGVKAHNFWWIELGGLRDTITDAEVIRDDLMQTVYGVWDYIKNVSPARNEAANWAIEWIGSLPGKRENRRYVGDHTLTQNDVRHGNFPDITAYGGWSMDDHHPAGLLYPGTPTVFHAAPAPFGIPYRVLYSRNIDNLFCAGRNISATHAALSSTRVMATCALLGQATGTAAALCTKYKTSPRGVYQDHVAELQQTLMDDDCWLPGLARTTGTLASSATLTSDGQGADLLLDGVERDRPESTHAWEGPLGSAIEYRWDTPQHVAGVRIVFDSNLADEKRMPCTYPQKGNRCLIPKSLVKRFRLDILSDTGAWTTAHREENNYQRLVQARLSATTRAVRLVCETTWGDPTARVFAFEPLATFTAKLPALPDGPTFQQVVSRIPPTDLAAPENGMETATSTKRRAGA